MEEEVTIILVIEKSDPLRYHVRPVDGDGEDIQEVEHMELYKHNDGLSGTPSQIINQIHDANIATDNLLDKRSQSLFKRKEFIKLCENLVLAGDGASQVRMWYDKLSRNVSAAHRDGIKILPDFISLSSESSIRDMMMSDVSHWYQLRVESFNNIISDAIYDYMTDPKSINPRTSPNAAMHLATSTTRDGLDLLYFIMCQTIPSLGGLYQDIGSLIASLDVVNGETLATFMIRAGTIEREIKDSGLIPSANAMLECILILLQQYRSAALHLSGLIRKYRRFRIQSMNKNKEFTPEATKLVLGELQLNGADMRLRLVKSSRPTNNQLPHNLPNTKPSNI